MRRVKVTYLPFKEATEPTEHVIIIETDLNDFASLLDWLKGGMSPLYGAAGTRRIIRIEYI